MGIIERIKEIIFKIKDYDRLESDYCTVLDMVTGARLSKSNYTMDAVRDAFNEFLDEHDKEAPEKVYFSSIGGGTHYYTEAIPFGREYIEYARKDAFIEKACDWFRRIDYDDSMPPFETTEEFIKGFKNYMKGE